MGLNRIQKSTTQILVHDSALSFVVCEDFRDGFHVAHSGPSYN